MNVSSEELISENTILNNIEVPSPTYYEVNQVIEKLKTHKAAGSDNIPAELIKQGGVELERRMHKLIMKMWEEETLPTEWTEGIICPIYKKGDRMICSSYRTITVLNVAYKIFTILINNRLSNIIESKLEDCQMGFRPKLSRIDNIFIVRQIIEKYHEFNIELHNIFINFTQKFDSDYGEKIIKCLNNCEIPSKIIKLIAKTLQDKKVRVKVNQNSAEKFEISTEVKQGDPLSTALFNIVIDDILTL
jgi:sorting nexin-29